MKQEKKDNSIDLTKISKEEVLAIVIAQIKEKGDLFPEKTERARWILDHARFPKDFKW